MFNKKDIITWYMNNRLVNTLKEINATRSSLAKTSNISLSEYYEMEDAFFNLMPYSNISSENYHITFNESGTAFIKQIFEHEIDDNTLVISTTNEHESVKEELDKCKHTLLLDYDNDIFNKGQHFTKLLNKILQFKKVFVYIIGTQFSTGQITPQSFLINLKQKLIEYGIEHKMLLDDVHGMFIVPRDYSLFDYILYTAHAIIPKFEMGLLISKNYDYGYKAFDWGTEYLPRLKKLLEYKEYLMYYRNMMIDYFSYLFMWPGLQLYENSVNHIFALRTTNLNFTEKMIENLDKYGIMLSGKSNEIGLMRIRFQDFVLQTPEKAIEGLELAESTLIKAIYINKMKGE